MVIKKKTMSPADQSTIENAEAQAEINRALIEYIAMMVDVDIPIEEDEENAQP